MAYTKMDNDYHLHGGALATLEGDEDCRHFLNRWLSGGGKWGIDDDSGIIFGAKIRI